MNLQRYSRQTLLSEIGPDGQSRIADGRVLCVGGGGLGSPALMYLAAAGVGQLGIVDDDHVDVSNLQRQILYQTEDQGRSKSDVARARLNALNPETRIQSVPERFTHLNATKLLANYDIVVDGSDNFGTKVLINDAAYKRGIPVAYGAVHRFEGQTALFWGHRGPCYRCLYPVIPRAAVPNCSETGVLGPVVGVIGSMQATLVLQYLVSGGASNHPLAPPIGQLAVFDLRGSWAMRQIQVGKQPECPTCSRPPAEVELGISAPGCTRTPTISPDILKSQLETGPAKVFLLDVRERSEWVTGHLPGAVHWPLSTLKLGKHPARKPSGYITVVYCQSGARSREAVTLLTNAGHTETYSLSGGLTGLPLVFQ